MIKPTEAEVKEFIDTCLSLDAESLLYLMISAEAFKARQDIVNSLSGQAS